MTIGDIDPNAASTDPFVTFTLELDKVHGGEVTMVRLRRNGVPVGLLRLKSEAEFEYLKTRVDGTFDPETGGRVIL